MKNLIKWFVAWSLRFKPLRRLLEASSDVGAANFQRDPDRFISSRKVTINGREIAFYPFGTTPAWRFDTLLSKEPETIEWIESFESGAVLWDIGANVGIYSLYAALFRESRVLAFEPSAVNYFVLNRNVHLNRLDSVVFAYPLAFCDGKRLGLFNMHSIDPGQALFHFGAERESITAGEHTAVVHFRQAMLGYSIDEFIADYHPPFPEHIKIDVDGIEDEIVRGARSTLSDVRLKSVLVELDDTQPEQRDAILSAMNEAGLKLLWKKHSPMFDTGAFRSIFNHCFTRTG